MGHTKYPIVLNRIEFCTGKCNRNTNHRAVIYPDAEYHTCLECSHKKTFHYPPQEGDPNYRDKEAHKNHKQ